MKLIDWNEEKNQKLKEERNVSFEEIIEAINTGRVIKTINHPNQKRYPRQKIMIVNIANYAYIVPYMLENERIFLKTIYPSRDATKKYIEKKL